MLQTDGRELIQVVLDELEKLDDGNDERVLNAVNELKFLQKVADMSLLAKSVTEELKSQIEQGASAALELIVLKKRGR